MANSLNMNEFLSFRSFCYTHIKAFYIKYIRLKIVQWIWSAFFVHHIRFVDDGEQIITDDEG